MAGENSDIRQANPNAVTDRDAKELIGEMMLRQIELSKTIAALQKEVQALQSENLGLREQMSQEQGAGSTYKQVGKE